MSGTVFELDDVVIARGGRTVVDGVTLAVRAGELMAVMGENGAGKSSLVHAMAGDLALERGSVRLHGQVLPNWSALEQARRRAVLPQHSALAFDFTALEVVLLGRSPHCAGYPGRRDTVIAREALALADAAHLAGRSILALSGGERARVMLARAIAQVMDGADRSAAGRLPRALLLDEPVAALDIAHRHGALRMLAALAKSEGMAVVAVLHDPDLAALHADRVVLLKHGRVIVDGSAGEALTEAHLRACFGVTMVRVSHPLRAVALIVAA